MKGKRRKGTTRGTLFRDLAKMRLLDAEVLLKGRRNEGAVYLAGYAVECALKWAITERDESVYLDEALETHDLDILLKASGLAPYMAEESKIRPLFSALADGWGPQGRYSGKRLTANEASLPLQPSAADLRLDHRKKFMNTSLKRKIDTFVAKALPASQEYEILAAPTGFDSSFVLRIITPAWSKIDKARRISRVESALLPNLTREEAKLIFRTSVLTPGEWSAMREHLVESGTKRIGGRKGGLVTSSGA